MSDRRSWVKLGGGENRHGDDSNELQYLQAVSGFISNKILVSTSCQRIHIHLRIHPDPLSYSFTFTFIFIHIHSYSSCLHSFAHSLQHSRRIHSRIWRTFMSTLMFIVPLFVIQKQLLLFGIMNTIQSLSIYLQYTHIFERIKSV